MSHEEIITEFKLKDDKLENRDFVRIEITPNVASPTRDKKDWTLNVDEQTTLPEWFCKNQKKAETICWKAWGESVKFQLAIGEEVLRVTDTYVESYGFSHVISYGSSHVISHDSSHVISHDSSHVISYGSSYVESHDSSHVISYGFSHVISHGSSHVISHDSSYVESHDSSHVISYGSSHVISHDSSYVESHDSSHVESHGSSYVEIKSEYAAVSCHGKIFVNKNAKVQVADVVKANEVPY
jgi:hypothetical protein